MKTKDISSNPKGFKMIRKCFSIMIITLLLSSSPLLAEDISFKEIPIKEAISFVSQITGRTYLYNGEDFNITWKRNNVTKLRLGFEFEEILKTYNVDIGRSGSTYTITQHGSTFINESVMFHRLNWLDAFEMAENLGKVWEDSLDIVAISSNLLIITGHPSSLEKLIFKIKKYDSPISVEIGQIKLKHVLASKVLEVIKQDEIIKTKVIADAWTNSILVHGNNNIQLLAESYASKMDHAKEGKNYEIIDLVNVASDNVVEALESIIDSASIKKISETKIMVAGLPSDVLRVTQMVADMDGERVQVHIEAVVAMLTDTQYKELGVRLGYESEDAQFSLGQLSVIYDPTILASVLFNQASVDLKASEGTGLSSVISEPSLMVKSGHEAEFLVGQEVPVKTSQSSSEEGLVTETTIERKDIGVKLNVKPTVRGEFIDMEIEQEISSISGTNSLDAVFNTESIKTNLMLANGQTMIIGGIKIIERKDEKDGVPYLSSIPLIGNIFDYNIDESSIKNIVISITAKIIKEV